MDKKKKETTKVVDKGIPGVIITDPLGSYTGRPEDKYEVPTQDADNL